MTNDIILKVEHVCQSFNGKLILHDINLDVVQGEFIAIVGPSGCGKSTLLRAILGTDPITSGTISVDGKMVTGPTRDVGVVYQDYRLYDFLDVAENTWLGLKLSQTSIPYRVFCFPAWRRMRRSFEDQAIQLLARVNMEESAAKYPSELSGGMKQRVAIAQSLIMKPKILLLDEAFGALDETNRQELQKMLLVLYQENMANIKAGKDPEHTVILVTHELEEAFYCCDRVVGLSRNWRDVVDGRELTGRELGATKVFDKAGPTYRPDDSRNFEKFAGLIAELRRTVFSDKIQDRFENVTFWEDLKSGVGTGVAFEWSEKNDPNMIDGTA
jgi:NitT/TauT family transport system ATP-binding protein